MTLSTTDAKVKLDGIAEGAEVNQTDSEIKTQYEANAGTNAFTDAEQTKLSNIEDSATGDMTGAEIKALYEVEPNAYTDTKDTKLSGIEALAEANQSDAEVKTQYEANADTNAFTDAEQTKLNSAAVLDAVNTFAAAQRSNRTTLTYAASVTPDFVTSNRFELALTGNTVMENPTNLVANQGGVIYIEQDSTGSREVTWGTYWKFPTSANESLTASTVDIYTYEVYSLTQIVIAHIGEI